MKPQYVREANQSKFEGVSTNKDDFKHFVGAQPAQIYNKKYQTHTQPNENRDFQTEAALKFTGAPAERQKSYKPAPSQLRQSVAFQGESTARTDYQGYTFARD